MEFSSQTVVVTGAAGNLGRAVASAFADGGANGVLVDRRVERLVERYGPETACTLYVAADLARPADTAAIAQRAFKLIEQVAEQEHLDVVLQEAIWSSPRIDITDKILKLLDK